MKNGTIRIGFSWILCLAATSFSQAQDPCPTTGASTSSEFINSTVTLKILLVEFSDVRHRTSPTAYKRSDFIDALVSSGGYVTPNKFSPDAEGVYGSMADWYNKMSGGNLTITGYVVNTADANDNPVWVTLPGTKMSYHNGNYFDFYYSAIGLQGHRVWTSTASAGM